MHPEISEFSYGYALTEELTQSSGIGLEAAPLFPSLIQEGQSGGYDVKIPFTGWPVFLQFKLCHYMMRSTAFECNQAGFIPPFYRMPLRPKKYSDQHDLLLDLEFQGNTVFYAAPLFHLPDDLNDAYLRREILERSALVRPSQIGTLPDENNHYVSFQDESNFQLFSEPIRLQGAFAGPVVLGVELLQDLMDRPKFDGTRESVEHLANTMLEVLSRHTAEHGDREAIYRIRSERLPRHQIAYITRAYLSCEVLLVRKRPEASVDTG